MNKDMSTFRKFDVENWPRKEHYKYYTERLKIQYNLTVEADVSKLLAYCHKSGRRFYPAFIYKAAKAVNSIENFRLFRNEQGELCLWDCVHPNYTIFHDDDKTFSDCWSRYSPDFDEFYAAITADMTKYKDTKGIKARANQPANFFCISVAPWTTFASFNSALTGGEPQFFPVITAGKYREVSGRMLMPVNMSIAHAVCDGYHAGLFFATLQRELESV